MNRFRYYCFLGFMLSSYWFYWRSPPARAAEKVSFCYGAFEFSLNVDSLETFAKTGKIDHSLAVYTDLLSPEELSDWRSLLTYEVKIDRVTLANFLNSHFGENILHSLGKIIKIGYDRNGLYAIRSSLILATDNSSGLTILKILRQFPTDKIKIDIGVVVELSKAFIQLIKQTQSALAAVEEQAAIEANTEFQVDFAQQPDIRQAGKLTWEEKSLTFFDEKRSRTINTKLYRPMSDASTPLIVISPGLGADADNFSDLARYLASYGFAVATLNHPGSDRTQIENFFTGVTREVIESREFIDRPQDISYLIDELQQRKLTNPKQLGNLNLDRVGVIGHSFGAYAALAIAGARLNLKHLQEYCQSNQIDLNWFNSSLLFQCLASELSSTVTNEELYDERIQAIFAINPISSSIFGEEMLKQFQIPVAFVAGSEDLVTPVLLEQIKPFSWLGSPEKYLLLIDKGTHIYERAETSDTSFNPKLARQYLKVMSLAFMKTHLVNRDYRSFLSSNYARYISQTSMKLNLINSLTEADLN